MAHFPAVKKWIIGSFTNSGSTTLISGVSDQIILIKHVIFTVDSGTDIYLCNDIPKALTCTFQFNSYGGMYSLDGAPLDIAVGKGKDLCVNSSNAVSGSIMVSIQKYTI